MLPQSPEKSYQALPSITVWTPEQPKEDTAETMVDAAVPMAFEMEPTSPELIDFKEIERLIEKEILSESA